MDTVAKEPRALARGRTSGVRALGYLGLFQVTRRKGGTISRPNRSNGYAHKTFGSSQVLEGFPSTKKISHRLSVPCTLI